MAMLAAGCGRIGVFLLPPSPDAGPAHYGGDVADAATWSQEAGVDAGRFVDAAIRPDAASGDAASQSQDAGLDAAIGVDAALDDGGTADASTPTQCAGRLVFGLCWYLGGSGVNCLDTCSRRGGFDARGSTHVGTTSQGGSAADCMQILTALGFQRNVVVATRDDGLGLGCHVWSDGTLYWLDDPSPHFAADVDVSPDFPARMACPCSR